jgi:hypothetical protein
MRDRQTERERERATGEAKRDDSSVRRWERKGDWGRRRQQEQDANQQKTHKKNQNQKY